MSAASGVAITPCSLMAWSPNVRATQRPGTSWSRSTQLPTGRVAAATVLQCAINIPWCPCPWGRFDVPSIHPQLFKYHRSWNCEAREATANTWQSLFFERDPVKVLSTTSKVTRSQEKIPWVRLSELATRLLRGFWNEFHRPWTKCEPSPGIKKNVAGSTKKRQGQWQTWNEDTHMKNIRTRDQMEEKVLRGSTFASWTDTHTHVHAHRIV
jgi:hypothetical protein